MEGAVLRAVCWLSLHWVGLLTMGLSDEPGHSQQASNVCGVDSAWNDGGGGYDV